MRKRLRSYNINSLVSIFFLNKIEFNFNILEKSNT